MKTKPELTEVTQLATQAIEYRKKMSITHPDITHEDAIEAVCGEALVPTTDEPLTINNVQEYLRLLQDAVSREVVSQLTREGERLSKQERG